MEDKKNDNPNWVSTLIKLNEDKDETGKSRQDKTNETSSDC